MKGPHRLPDFLSSSGSKRTKTSELCDQEVLAAAGAEPYEMTEYQGMVDFHWATSSVVDARKLAEASEGSGRPTQPAHQRGIGRSPISRGSVPTRLPTRTCAAPSST
jgi:hypothetical protein